jgi:hypothetical protein
MRPRNRQRSRPVETGAGGGEGLIVEDMLKYNITPENTAHSAFHPHLRGLKSSSVFFTVLGFRVTPCPVFAPASRPSLFVTSCETSALLFPRTAW